MVNTQTDTLKKTFTVRMTENKLSLNWKDFETNMTAALKDLREEKDFFDVTIACEDNQIQAHKVILSACSAFFRNLLRRNPHQHPLLYLKGVKYKELLGILDFMYNGEVNVEQEELKQFLAVAADLKVKGLTQMIAIVKPHTQDYVKVKREPEVRKPARKHQISMTGTNVGQVDIIDTLPEQPLLIQSPKYKESPKLKLKRHIIEQEDFIKRHCPSFAKIASGVNYPEPILPFPPVDQKSPNPREIHSNYTGKQGQQTMQLQEQTETEEEPKKKTRICFNTNKQSHHAN